MDYLWTPWRSTYMKEKKDNMQCVFCSAAQSAEDTQNLVIHRGQFCFIILNRYPYTSGHLMVAPYTHVSRLTAADKAATAEMMEFIRCAETAIQEVYSPDGLNLGMNLGEAAGAGIEQHIHMHVLPRWKGDANFMTSVGGTRIIPEMLEDTYTKLQEAFGKLAR